MLPHTDPEPVRGLLPAQQDIDWDDPQPVQFASCADSTRSRSFFGVLQSRRSCRIFGEAPINLVAEVVRSTLRVTFVGEGTNDGRVLKAVVSAGALHPVKAVIVISGSRPVFYADMEDRFLSIGIRNELYWKAFHEKCRGVLPSAHGHWVFLFADRRNLSALYKNSDSLLFRDAGAVIQTMALVAEAYNLEFCPLGILGHELIEALLPNSKHFIAVGVVAIGGPKSSYNGS